ncbi:2,3-dihydro-2,3-dihydroxybenzoate dehydrogenase [Amycolatopsis aidingensis]|uniref:2,3-dihydro-2,3-dihydroxybenzoate dehydrogenase n=1 Tax=Amycolatopsis aidingensis TaxID=2842453 RepID=UPI001C0AAF67|nr:2,3-dihydro-2,3-dihydroxybenzoate dehydrogenase [Amycolatopsis aidingensis]
MLGKTALVTGAAGGIGAAVVRALAAEGAAVAAVDVDAEALQLRVKALVAEGHRVRAFAADVSTAASVDAAVDAAERELGPLRYLVNAAGVLRPGPVTECSEHEWNTTFAVNTTGVFQVSRAVALRMIPRREGAIVTVASNAATLPRHGMAAYAASKAAAASFTKSLGLELAEHGIRCNVVAPGTTETPMIASLYTDADALRATIEGMPASYRVGIPLRKLATPEDIADAVLFLLSERAAHITLHDLTVDGGAGLGR